MSTLAQPKRKLDFFIAHAAKDKKRAELLYSCLHTRAEVFLAAKSLRLGKSWDLAVREAQKEAAVTVILVSKATDEAFYQREEIARAIAHAREQPAKHTVIPIFLNSVPELESSSTSTPYGLVGLHGLTLSRSFTMKDAADALIEELSLAEREKEDSGRFSDQAEVGEKCAVDVCLCVDAGPEAGVLLEGILNEALKFPHLLTGQLSAQYQNIEQLRVRVLTFGADVDFDSMQDEDTGFLEYPGDAAKAAAQAQKMMHGRHAAIQSRALIALERAIRSRWCAGAPRLLHVIAIWSASPLQMDEEALDRLNELWEDHGSTGLSPTEKRLVIFAPGNEAWNYISNNFNNTLWRAGVPGSSRPDEFDEIMKALTTYVQPQTPQYSQPVFLSGYCINTALNSRELQRQARIGGQQRIADSRKWVTGRQLLAEAKKAGERMPIIFSDPDDGSLIYWAIIDDITIDHRTGTTCFYSELRELEPSRPRSELRLRKTNRPIRESFTNSHAVCCTPGFLVPAQLPNADS